MRVLVLVLCLASFVQAGQYAVVESNTIPAIQPPPAPAVTVGQSFATLSVPRLVTTTERICIDVPKTSVTYDQVQVAMPAPQVVQQVYSAPQVTVATATSTVCNCNCNCATCTCNRPAVMSVPQAYSVPMATQQVYSTQQYCQPCQQVQQTYTQQVCQPQQVQYNQQAMLSVPYQAPAPRVVTVSPTMVCGPNGCQEMPMTIRDNRAALQQLREGQGFFQKRR